MRRQIPVEVEFQSHGSFNDVFDDFSKTMKAITGDYPDLEIDLDGKVTVYFKNQKIEKRPYNDIDVLYRSKDRYDLETLLNKKINESDSAMKNNESGYAEYRRDKTF
jgi:hypothetical protein